MAFHKLLSTLKSCRPLVNRDGQVLDKYRHFRAFLTHNHDALSIIAELEQIYYDGGAFSMAAVKKKYGELLESIRKLTEVLNGLADGKYPELSDICRRIDEEIGPIFHPAPSHTGDLVVLLEDLTPEMMQSAGPKATNLALIEYQLGAPVPHGFVITAHAFERFLAENGLPKSIEDILAGISSDSPENTVAQSKVIQKMILKARIPKAIDVAILKAYKTLEAKTHRNLHLAMRSSAVGEDTESSFAGQYATILNVTQEGLLGAYREILASKYSARAILYRMRYGLDDRDTPMCVAGIAMVDSRASGVLYTVDPSQPDASTLSISAIYGLGEHLVSGEASPDVFCVDKNLNEIIKREIRRKNFRLISLAGGGTRLVETPDGEKELPSIDDDMVHALARYGKCRQPSRFGGPGVWYPHNSRYSRCYNHPSRG